MVDFIRKRLQVFVSSTYTDLIQDRQAAVEAILAAGHIPAGMELFTAGDESQMEVIHQWIDESDVYVLILGGRYGSIEPKSEKSYTHLEYEYAVKSGKPVFACVITDQAIEARVKEHGRSVIEQHNQAKLTEFRHLVLSKVSKFWGDSKDIKIAVIEKLSELARRDDLVGWVRADQVINVQVTDELARLSSENANLRSQLEQTDDNTLLLGVEFQTLHSLLDEKGLNKFLEINRKEFGHPNGVYPSSSGMHDNLRDLSIHGIVAAHTDTRGTRYKLTDAGHSYLNKLDSQRLDSHSKG